MSQASELRDILAALRAHEQRLDDHDARLEDHDNQFAAFGRMIAALDRQQQTFENQIEVFRDGINDSCQRAVRESREIHETTRRELLAELRRLLPPPKKPNA